MNKIKVGVLLSGSGTNFQALADACKDEYFPAEIVSVGSNEHNAYGIQRAIKEGIHNWVAHYVEARKVERFATMFFEEQGVELICLAGYMKMLTKEFIEHWNGKILNIHPSLLPAFKGLHAPRQAIEYGVQFTGCTVHWVVPEMDAGPIVGQRLSRVFEEDTEKTIAQDILSQEHQLYPDVLNKVATKMLEERND